MPSLPSAIINDMHNEFKTLHEQYEEGLLDHQEYLAKILDECMISMTRLHGRIDWEKYIKENKP